LVKVLFDVEAGGLGRLLSKVPVPQSVDDAQQALIRPLLEHHGIAVFSGPAAGTTRGAELQSPDRNILGRGPNPPLAKNAQSSCGAVIEVQLIHQAVNRAQPLAKAARRGISVGDSQFNVGNAGTFIFRFDLDSFAVRGRQRC
jgi:hypothetical protein